MSKKVNPVREALWHAKKCPKCNNFSVTYEIERFPNKTAIEEINKKLKNKKLKLTDDERAGLEMNRGHLQKQIVPLKPAYANHREVMLREHIRIKHLSKDIVAKAEDLQKLELKYQQELLNRDTLIQDLQFRLENVFDELYPKVLKKIEDEYNLALTENPSDESKKELQAKLDLLLAENKKLKEGKEEK